MQDNKIVKYENFELQKINDTTLLTNKLLFINLKSINIFWLEDHELYFKGVCNCILKKFPNAIFTHVRDGDKALEFMINYNKNNPRIDLIITDIKHPGISGIEFASVIRNLEINNKFKIPILFITMMDDSFFVDQIAKIPFTKFLPKVSSCEQINFAIYNLT